MTPWAQTCTERLAVARTWDQSNRYNRAGVRAWRRRLWWARYGFWVSAALGASVGGVLVALTMLAIRGVL